MSQTHRLLDPTPADLFHSKSLSHSLQSPHSSSSHSYSMQPCSPLPTKTDVIVVGNGPAGILISLLLSGYEPYYHAEPSRPHPDPILHRMLSPSALQGCRPRSLLQQDFVQLTNHIQHQLAEAGRDANPVSALFDSLAHPYLDTHRGEYPSFLEWRHNDSSIPPAQCTDQKEQSTVQSPPPTPTFQAPAVLGRSTARPHIVLGRGDVGGIWADMEEDHNQTLSYNEHMELPLYSFTDFVDEHPEHGHNLDRPLRSTVSAYYKAYIRQTGIQSNFSNYTTVTGIYHLKDLKNHCCCSLDPQTPHRSSAQTPCRDCASYRYAVLGYTDSPGGTRDAKARRTKFLVRSKTVVLATGTFDKPKKLPAVSAHPCEPPACPAATIQQTFHDTRQLEEWMSKHNGSTSSLPQQESADSLSLSTASPPLSPAASSSPHLSDTSLSANLSSMLEGRSTLPIVIVGTGLSAADAILLIQEKQPWRRIIHIYKHFSASEPSPLKRCHRDVYPEYASVWVRMKKFATLKNSVQSYQRKEGGHCSVFGSNSSDGKSAMPCLDCKNLVPEEFQATQGPGHRCLGCSYKGLPDASVSSWDPLTGEIVIILSHGVVVKERVAAVGVFIGKQVHMGFLKGSLAQEMLSTGENGLGIGSSAGMSTMRRRMGGRRGSRSGRNRDSMVEIPTPPCTPPHSPLLRPRSHFRQRQKSVLEGSRGLGLTNAGQDEETRDEGAEDDGDARVEGSQECTGQDDDVVEQYQVLTLLRPLVSDMYNFRIIPTVVSDDPAVAEAGTSAAASSQLHSSSVAPSSVYPVKPKRCTRLPCYPVRTSSSASSLAAGGGGSCGPETVCDAPDADADATDADQKVEGETRTSKGFAARAMSCISMPCSPLLSSRASYPSLPTPPLLTLCSAAASALSSSIAALSPTRVSFAPAASSPSSSSGTLSASSSTSSLVSDATASSSSEVDCCGAPPSTPLEKEMVPLMDQSIYAAGAITGSKFVRYVLGNGVAIVADILKSEA